MAKLATKLAKLPGAEAQGEWDPAGPTGADAPANQADAATAGLAARVRLMMLISGLTTLIAIAAVVGVIGYRIYHSGGSGAGPVAEGIVTLPKTARVIATAVAGLYLVWFWKRWLIALAPVILLVAFLAGPDFVRNRMHSIFHAHDREFRVVTWRTGFRMIQAHPWLGLGPEQVNRESVVRYLPPDVHEPLPSGWYGHLHNIYLHYAAERGIPALLALLWMLIMMLTDFWRALRHLPPGPSDRRFVLHGAIAVILATMVAGMFEHNLGDSEVLTMFLVVAACGYVAAEEEPAVA